MRALVVYCHPRSDSFAGAMRDSAVSGLRAAGHDVRVTDLYAQGFEPQLSAWERVHHLAPPDTKPAIAQHADDLRWCDALVLVYPTWWSGPPAMLKGWIDRVWVRGVAYDLPEGANRITPMLRNIRRIVVVTCHGSGKWVNSLQGEGGKRIASRSLRVLCHRRARFTWLSLYGTDRVGADERTRFLARVERGMRRL